MLEKISRSELISNGANNELLEDIINEKIILYKSDSLDELNNKLGFIQEEAIEKNSKLLVTLIGKKHNFSRLPLFLETPENSTLIEYSKKQIHAKNLERLSLSDVYEKDIKVKLENEQNKEILYALYLAELNNNKKIMLKYCTIFIPNNKELVDIELVSSGPIAINDKGFIPSYYFSTETKFDLERYFR